MLHFSAHHQLNKACGRGDGFKFKIQPESESPSSDFTKLSLHPPGTEMFKEVEYVQEPTTRDAWSFQRCFSKYGGGTFLITEQGQHDSVGRQQFSNLMLMTWRALVVLSQDLTSALLSLGE